MLIENLESLEELAFRVDREWDELYVNENILIDGRQVVMFLTTLHYFCKNLQAIEILVSHEDAEWLIRHWKRFVELAFKVPRERSVCPTITVINSNTS